CHTATRTCRKAARREEWVFCGYPRATVEVRAKLYSILDTYAARKREILMKHPALLIAALLLLLPAQTRSQELGHWELRLAGYHQDGRPHYARVYCRADGHCYRPRRPLVVRHGATRVYAYERREFVDES